MSVYFDRTRTDEFRRVLPDTPPVVDASLWRGVVNGLIASAFCWEVIVGCGYLGYRIGQSSWL
jgi:hypothetical protein